MGCVIPTHLHITIIKLTLNPHTMNLHQLWLITRYSFTEIWRNKTFRVAFMVLIPLLIAYQVSFQSDMFNIPVEYTLVLSSFIPTQNAYMFNLLLVFPLATRKRYLLDRLYTRDHHCLHDHGKYLARPGRVNQSFRLPDLFPAPYLFVLPGNTNPSHHCFYCGHHLFPCRSLL